MDPLDLVREYLIDEGLPYVGVVKSRLSFVSGAVAFFTVGNIKILWHKSWNTKVFVWKAKWNYSHGNNFVIMDKNALIEKGITMHVPINSADLYCPNSLPLILSMVKDYWDKRFWGELQ
jgi:hypothetical protein